MARAAAQAGGPARPGRPRLAAAGVAAALVVSAHLALLLALSQAPGPAAPARPASAVVPAAGISWLKVVVPLAATRGFDSPPLLAPRPARAKRADDLRHAPLLRGATPAPLADDASVPSLALSAPPAPLVPPLPMAAVRGVALAAQEGAFGGAGAFGGFGGAGAFGRRGVERGASGLRAPLQPTDEAPVAAHAQLVAVLMRQLQGLGPAPALGSGRCRPAEGERLRCDHAEADEAVAAAGAAIATLLHTLAALDPRLREPALTYAEGRFSIALR